MVQKEASVSGGSVVRVRVVMIRVRVVMVRVRVRVWFGLVGSGLVQS